MREMNPLPVAALILAMVACSSAPVKDPADAGPVSRILRVETPDAVRYRAAMDEGRRIMRDLGVVPTIRIEVEEHAPGEESSLVRLHITYPDRATREVWSDRLQRSDRYLEWAESLDTMRTVLSDEEE